MGDEFTYLQVPELEERIWRSKAYMHFSNTWKVLVGKDGYNVYRAKIYATKQLELVSGFRIGDLSTWDIDICKKVIKICTSK